MIDYFAVLLLSLLILVDSKMAQEGILHTADMERNSELLLLVDYTDDIVTKYFLH